MILSFALSLCTPKLKIDFILPAKTKGVFRRLSTFLCRCSLVAQRRVIIWVCGLLSVLVPVHSWAGGLYISEFGTSSTGVANAGATAYANDASTTWHNPAGMTRISGTQVMGAAGLLIPNIKFDPDPNTPVPGGDGGQAGLLAPVMGTHVVHSLSDKLKLGFSVGSISGAGLDYGSDWAGRRQTTEIKLLTITAQPTVAFKPNDWLSVGVAFQASYGRLHPLKLRAPNPAESTIKVDGDDMSFGYIVGALIDLSEWTRLGVKYQSQNKFKFDGELKVTGGALGGINVNSKLEILLPQTVEVGLYHEVNDQFALLATVDWEDWSQFGEIPLSVSTGQSGAIPTGWDDTYKLAGGIHYRPSEPWLLMTGIAYDSSPVNANSRTADMPIDRQLRYSVGAQYEWSERLSLGGFFEYIDLGNAKINSNVLKGDFRRNEMFFIGFNANWKF